MDNATKVLIANSEPLPEMEDEYDGQDELINDAENKSMMIDIISTIGVEGFEYTYYNLINEIRLLDISEQISLCIGIINKITEVYKFEFLQKIEIYTQADCEDVYKFVTFLEFDHIDFFVNLLEGIVYDLRKEAIRIIIDQNWNEIERRILKENLSRLIILFLRTNNKEDLIDFFVSKITQNKIIITMKLFERRMENGESNN